MWLSVVACLALVSVHQSTTVAVFEKCCEENSEVSADLKCVPKTSNRSAVLVRFASKTSRSECIDTTKQDFFIFQRNFNRKLVKTRQLFPKLNKCCPSHFVYDPRSRSCTRSSEAETTFSKDNAARIGLPDCKLITDRISENITELNYETIQHKDSYCIDKTYDNKYVVRECQEGLELCKVKRCLKKCCPDGQSFVGGGFCKDTLVHGVQVYNQTYSSFIDDIDDEYEVIYGVHCPQVVIHIFNGIQYRITNTGSFKFYYNYSESFVEEDVFDLKSYCFEHAAKQNIAGFYLFTCYDKQPIIEKFTFTLWAKVLSCIFLFLTMLIYFCVGETKQTFGKILINYCLAVMFLMITLTVAHLHVASSPLECKIRGYFIILFNLSTFAWLNVMSLNIWWTFSTPKRSIVSYQKKKEFKKFLIYSLYGWGVPLCLDLLILFLENTQFLPKAIQPYVGIFYCMFEKRNYAPTLFFLLPQLIFQTVNIVLFVKTIVYCIKVKNEIYRLNDSSKSNEDRKFVIAKERLGLIVKLAIIMGVIWIFEVVTAFVGDMKSINNFTKILEIILDTIICLQGIFIFMIFICKKKTYNMLKKRFNFKQRRVSHCMSMTTQSTQSTSHHSINKRQATKTSINGN